MIDKDIKKELDKIYKVAKNDKKLEESFKWGKFYYYFLRYMNIIDN